MNDNDELKARSIELAERAIRLRDRALDEDTKKKLHYVNNELINIDNRQRFYDAQTPLELVENWTEDQRALAHEINVADRQMRGIQSFNLEETVNQLIEIIDRMSESPSLVITKVAESLQILLSNRARSERKAAVNYVLAFLEDALQKEDEGDVQQNESVDPTLIKFRNMRDSLLVHRELLYDAGELVEEYRFEGEKIERLGLLRHELDELYSKAQ